MGVCHTKVKNKNNTLKRQVPEQYFTIVDSKYTTCNLFTHQRWEPTQPNQSLIAKQSIVEVPQEAIISAELVDDYLDDLPETQKQTRFSVEQEQLRYLPYSAIGYLTIKFNYTDKMYYGIAILIAENLALTCAHNCFHPIKKIQAIQMVLYMGFNKGKGTRFEIEKFYYPNQLKQNGFWNHLKNCAVLVIQENPGKIYGHLGVIFDEQITVEDQLSVIGYPISFQGKHNIIQKQLVHCEGTGQLNEQKNELIYKMTTSSGQSGSAIIKRSQQTCYLVGIHIRKDIDSGESFGLYLNQNLQIEISFQMVEEVIDLTDLNLNEEWLEKMFKPQYSGIKVLRLKNTLKEIIKQETTIPLLQRIIILKKELIELDLSHNQIFNIYPSSFPTSLIVLSLNNNELYNFFIWQMKKKTWENLKILNLSSNNLSYAQFPKSSYPVLTHLNLSGNVLCCEFLKILGEQKHEKLVELDLSGNPIFFNSKLILTDCQFPHLQILNLKKIIIEEQQIEKIYQMKIQKKCKVLFEKDQNWIERAKEIQDKASEKLKKGYETQALLHYESALNIYQSVIGANCLESANILHNVGLTYYTLGKYEDSLDYYERALRSYQRFKGRYCLQSANTLNNIGNLYNAFQKYKEALQYYQQALDIYQQFIGKGCLQSSDTISNIGNIHNELGDFKLAIQYYEKALRIDYIHRGQGSYESANTLNNIGTMWEFLKEYSKALNYYDRALQIKNRFKGEGCLESAHILLNIGELFEKRFEKREIGITYYTKAFEIAEKFLGSNNPKTQQYKQILVCAQKQQLLQLQQQQKKQQQMQQQIEEKQLQPSPEQP